MSDAVGGEVGRCYTFQSPHCPVKSYQRHFYQIPCSNISEKESKMAFELGNGTDLGESSSDRTRRGRAGRGEFMIRTP